MHNETIKIMIPFDKIPFRWKFDAVVSAAITLWCMVNTFWIVFESGLVF